MSCSDCERWRLENIFGPSTLILLVFEGFLLSKRTVLMPSSLSATAPRVEVKEWQKELEEMPVEEQLKATRDLYGEANPIDETPELLQAKMDEFRACLESVVGGEDFLEAQTRVPDVVNSFDFRLMFLRAVQFDAKVRISLNANNCYPSTLSSITGFLHCLCLKLAAQKMVKYWEHKVKLFGPEIAFREGGKILLSDLNDDDLATLDANGLFWLPNDAAGRGVIFSRRQLWTFRHNSNMVGSGLISRSREICIILVYLYS